MLPRVGRTFGKREIIIACDQDVLVCQQYTEGKTCRSGRRILEVEAYAMPVRRTSKFFVRHGRGGEIVVQGSWKSGGDVESSRAAGEEGEVVGCAVICLEVLVSRVAYRHGTGLANPLPAIRQYRSTLAGVRRASTIKTSSPEAFLFSPPPTRTKGMSRLLSFVSLSTTYMMICCRPYHTNELLESFCGD